jgi:hypothetical protein
MLLCYHSPECWLQTARRGARVASQCITGLPGPTCLDGLRRQGHCWQWQLRCLGPRRSVVRAAISRHPTTCDCVIRFLSRERGGANKRVEYDMLRDMGTHGSPPTRVLDVPFKWTC